MQPAELLILAAVSSERTTALSCWNQWQALGRLEELDDAEQRLLPLLYRNLIAHGVEEDVIPPLCQQLYRQSWIRSRSLVRELERVLTCLRAGGVETLVLKGAALIAAYYEDPSVRPMGDFDVLVSPADAPRAARLLEAEGWRSSLPLDRNGMTIQHGCELKKGEWGCDLHWSVFWESLEVDSDLSLWRDSQPATIGSTPIRILRPEHQLLHLAVHGTRRNEGGHVRWIADALTVLGRHASDFDWALFEAEARSRGFEFPVGEAIEYLRERFGAQVPPALIGELRRKRVSALRRRVYVIRLVDVDHSETLGFIAPLWFKFLRQSRGGTMRRVLWFPRNLQHAWKLQSLRRLPVELLRRGARKGGQVFKRLRRKSI